MLIKRISTLRIISTAIKYRKYHESLYWVFRSSTKFVNQNISQMDTSTTISFAICIELFSTLIIGITLTKNTRRSVLRTSEASTYSTIEERKKIMTHAKSSLRTRKKLVWSKEFCLYMSTFWYTDSYFIRIVGGLSFSLLRLRNFAIHTGYIARPRRIKNAATKSIIYSFVSKLNRKIVVRTDMLVVK